MFESAETSASDLSMRVTSADARVSSIYFSTACCCSDISISPRTSSSALTIRTLPFILTVANYGFEEAVARHPELHRAVNAYRGVITHQGVAESLGREWRSLDELIAANGAG